MVFQSIMNVFPQIMAFSIDKVVYKHASAKVFLLMAILYPNRKILPIQKFCRIWYVAL